MNTTNPIPFPVIKLEQVPELTNFGLRVDPPKAAGDRTMATLFVMKGEQQVFDCTMPIEEMRRVLFELHEGIAQHMEGM